MSTPRTSVKMAALAPIPSASVMTTTNVTPGDWRSWRSANLRSFISFSPQCFDWVDQCRAPSRDETGSGRNQCQQSGDGEINGRIECVDFEENVFEGSARGDSKKQRNSHSAQN